MALLILLFASSLNALDVQVSVLEAPIFSRLNDASMVKQYLRRGDKIFVHDSFNQNGMYKTIAADGSIGFIRQEHVYILSKNSSELEQFAIEEDETDYRIKEPIAKNYPFLKKGGYAAGTYWSYTNQAPNSYPFSNKIRDYSSARDNLVNIFFERESRYIKSKRVYEGIDFIFNSSSHKLLIGATDFTQKRVSLSFGPSLSFLGLNHKDFFIKLKTHLYISLLDRLEIESNNDTFRYEGYSLIPGVNFLFGIKSITPMIDMIIGLDTDYVIPVGEFKSDSSALEQSFSADSFLRVGLLVGFQTSY